MDYTPGRENYKDWEIKFIHTVMVVSIYAPDMVIPEEKSKINLQILKYSIK